MIRHLDIPKERWTSFLRLFDRHMSGQPIRVEVVGRPLGDQEMGNLLPFQGVDFDSKGSERGSLTITVGSDRGELTHRIISPTRMYLGLNDAGAAEWLAIEEVGEAGDAQTLVHFEQLPELEAEYREGKPA